MLHKKEAGGSQFFLFPDIHHMHQRRGGVHVLRIGARFALRDGFADAFEEPHPIGRELPFPVFEVHRCGFEPATAVGVDIGVLDQLRAIMPAVEGAEIIVVRFAQEHLGLLHIDGRVAVVLQAHDLEGRGAAPVQRKVREQRVERMTVDPVRQGRINHPDGIVFIDFQDGGVNVIDCITI